MSDEVVPVPAKWAKRARINAEGYTAAVRSVEDDPWGYSGELGRRLTWNKPFTQVLTHLESACDITASLRKQPSGGDRSAGDFFAPPQRAAWRPIGIDVRLG